jgi:hypothetical protein
MTKCYSYDGEDFYKGIDSFVDKFEEHHEKNHIIEIFEADAIIKKASDYFVASDILEWAEEKAWDNLGESTEQWGMDLMKNKDSFEKDLAVFVDQWADKHKLQPTFYGVENIKPIKIKYLGDCDYEIINEDANND